MSYPHLPRLAASSPSALPVARRAPRRHLARRLMAGALAAGIALVGIGLDLGANVQPARAADDAVSISEGTVTWGIKESWRNYMGGGELSGGVSALPSGEYQWPIESGAFDESTQTLTLELGGSAHYRGYCADSGFCQLDSTFEDLALEISADHQVIRGTYIGRPQGDPGGPLQRSENGVIAELDIYDAQPTVADGTTTWSEIPATAGDGMILYSGGIPIDPVSISYSGPGGEPDLAERWDTPGAPRYTAGAEWVPAPYRFGEQPAVYASASSDALVATEFLGVSDGVASLRFSALDATTLEPIGQTEIAAGTSAETQTAFDPKTNTVFFMQRAVTTDQARISLHAAQWNSETSAFDISELSSFSTPRGAGIGIPNAGGVLAWNDVSEQVLWTTFTNQAGHNDSRTDIVLHTLSRSDGVWEREEAGLDLPAEVLADPTERSAATFLVQSLRSERNSVSLSDGSMLFAFGSTYFNADWDEIKRPITRLAPLENGRWSVAYLEDTVAPDTTGYGVGPSAYSAISRSADGNIMAFGSDWSGTLGYLPTDDYTAAMEHVDPYPDAFTYSSVNAAADPVHGYDLSLDPFQKSIAVVRDHQLLTEFSIPVNQRSSTFLVTGDGALITAVESADGGPQPLRRYEVIATAPQITQQPGSATLPLTQGALSSSTSLALTIDDAEAEVQWQRKFPGQQRFANIGGATEATYAPELTLEQSGAEFRAVVTNDAGSVVSETAAITVVSAPRFAQQPVSLSVYDGDTAVFTAPIAAGIAGEQRWEQRVDDTWVTVENDDAHTAEGATLSVVASEVVDGQQYRSVLTNEVGENVSDEVALTVVPKGTIPEGGLTYTGVGFEWDGNAELQHKSPVGAANYLSAGISDGTASTYLARSGGVTILHETNGQRLVADYDSRESFLAAAGRQLVQLSNGVAKVQADGSAVVTWSGSWSVNMYGGMVPFTFTNPVLTVQSDGTGTLSADLSGYAGSMANPDQKTPLAPVPSATVATFQAVTVDVLNGFTVTPDYRGVEVTIPAGSDAVQQQRTGVDWGAWPQPFVDFQIATGLSSYWYSSGATADANKVAHPFLVDFSEAREGEPEPTTTSPLVTQHPQSVSAQVGDRPSFSASASGDPAPTVQWQSRRVAVTPEATVGNAGAPDTPADWEDVSEATSPTFTSPRIEESDAGTVIEYRAVFANSAGSVATNAATLEIAPIDAGAGTASSSSDASGVAGAESAGTGSQAGANADSGSAGAGASGDDQGGTRAADGSASGATTDLAATGSDGVDALWIAAVLLLAAGSVGLVLSRRRALRASAESCNIR